ncbi:hypothetical protein [Actinacidiphila sp. ITFR-21]|uniref:hypothetical protein n=1 Tax=Actinacidiphila sp. ITFR-21 TaxID=3075199 RepID=UPI00288B423F|nr:hypothetical protein [Streptomyces sp. ITFR-21]WNI16948.1 hypothetical protein RLT57_16390 [Streptomyces sp. ITFR-21]
MKWNPADWERLGRRIRERREGLGFSREKLGAIASASPKTIQNAEDGRVPTRWPSTFGRIESSLGWLAGSFREVLDGGEPTELDSGLFDEYLSAVKEPNAPTLERRAEIRSRLERGHHLSVVERMTLSEMGRTEQFPEEIEVRLRAVFEFGQLCERYGAPSQLTAGYDYAVADLLAALVEARKGRGSVTSRPAGYRTSTASPHSSQYHGGAFSGEVSQGEVAKSRERGEGLDLDGRKVEQREASDAELVERLVQESERVSTLIETLKEKQATVAQIYQKLAALDDPN